MSYGSYLSRSPSGSFYFRLRLPRLLAQQLGVNEVRRSLRTNDAIEARRKALELFQQVGRIGASQASATFLERSRAIRGRKQSDGPADVLP